MEKGFGLRWKQFNQKGRIVNKEKWFITAEKREAFLDKLEEKGNLYQVDVYCDEE